MNSSQPRYMAAAPAPMKPKAAKALTKIRTAPSQAKNIIRPTVRAARPPTSKPGMGQFLLGLNFAGKLENPAVKNRLSRILRSAPFSRSSRILRSARTRLKCLCSCRPGRGGGLRGRARLPGAGPPRNGGRIRPTGARVLRRRGSPGRPVRVRSFHISRSCPLISRPPLKGRRL